MAKTIKNTEAELEGLRIPELQARFREVVGEITKSPNRKFLVRRILEAVGQKEAEATASEPAQAPAAEVQPEVVVATETESETASAPNEPVAATEPDAVVETKEEGATEGQAAPETAEGEGQRAPAEEKPTRPARGRFAGLTVEELTAKYLEVVGRPTGSTDRAYLIWKIREAEMGRVPVGPVQPRTTNTEPADIKVLPLRLGSAAVTAMDEAWRTRGAKSRTEFLRAALHHYLNHLGATEAAAHLTAE